MNRRITAIILILCMMIGTFSATSVNVDAASSGEVSQYKIEERLAQLTSLSGLYFTINGRSNGSSCNYSVMKKNSNIRKLMSNYKGAKSISAYANIPGHFDWTANGRGNISSKAWQCAGFANFCTWWLYSADYKTKVNVRCVKQNVKYSYKNMNKYVKKGDVLRTNKGNPGHSMIVLSMTKSYVKVLDNNWDHNNRIKVHKIKFKSNYAKGLRVGITRGKPYRDYFRHRFEFDAGEGSGTISPVYVNDQQTLVIPSSIPKRAGFVFKGWIVKRLIDGKWFGDGSWSTGPSVYKLYQPGAKYLIDGSWRKAGGADSHYRFCAIWEKNTTSSTVKVAAETRSLNHQDAENKEDPAEHMIGFCLDDGEDTFSDTEVTEVTEADEGNDYTLLDEVPVEE